MSDDNIDAEFRRAVANKPYRPSNGTEGDYFYEAWCCNCARDKAMSEGKDYDQCAPDEVCQIIADTLAYDLRDPEYPKEWVYDERGYPKCTAFVPVGKVIPIQRCERTPDMFGDAA